jgi:hypothetical protein
MIRGLMLATTALFCLPLGGCFAPGPVGWALTGLGAVASVESLAHDVAGVDTSWQAIIGDKPAERVK